MKMTFKDSVTHKHTYNIIFKNLRKRVKIYGATIILDSLLWIIYIKSQIETNGRLKMYLPRSILK